MKRGAALVNNLFKIPLTIFFKLCYRLEVTGADRCPRKGGLVVVCNHQSLLDPMLLGVALPRVLVYTPRASLHQSRIYRWLTAGLDLEHVERDGRDIAATRRMIERVKRGDALALFPEQTRSSDGLLGRVTPGFHMIAAHGGVPVLPVVIEGAWEAWPRGQKRPNLSGKVRMRVGLPLDVKELPRDEAARRVEAAFLGLGAKRRDGAATPVAAGEPPAEASQDAKAGH